MFQQATDWHTLAPAFADNTSEANGGAS